VWSFATLPSRPGDHDQAQRPAFDGDFAGRIVAAGSRGFGWPHPETQGRRTATEDRLRDPADMSCAKRKLFALLVAAAPVVAAILVALNAGSHGG